MATIQDVLAKVLPTERGVYTGKDKPTQYITYLRVTAKPDYADDEVKEIEELYRVTLYSKTDYENTLDAILKAIDAAGYYLGSVDAENYETETGYWVVPITLSILKE